MNKEDIIKQLITLEGDYVDDPRDSGGATKYGITEAVARKHGFQGNMKYLSYETAYDIYEKDYWNAFKGDELVKLDSELIEMLLETSALCSIPPLTPPFWSHPYEANDHISLRKTLLQQF